MGFGRGIAGPNFGTESILGFGRGIAGSLIGTIGDFLSVFSWQYDEGLIGIHVGEFLRITLSTRGGRGGRGGASEGSGGTPDGRGVIGTVIPRRSLNIFGFACAMIQSAPRGTMNDKSTLITYVHVQVSVVLQHLALT